jgi:hypothetical protein
MAYEPGDIKVFNPNKEISKEITLEILIRHRDALKQARTGELLGVPIENLKDNDRKMNQVRALNLIISAQREMITISRPILFFKSTQKWKKEFKDDGKNEKSREENPFDKYESDYKTIKTWLEFLGYCQKAIITAEKTKSLDDDFITTRQTQDGDVLYLSENFNAMLEDLEDSYEQIYLLMLTNKIVSAGIEEDEEMSYKEKEQEAIRRVVEA